MCHGLIKIMTLIQDRHWTTMLCLIITVSLAGYASATCKSGWTPVGQHCYFRSHGDEGMDWGSAETTCAIHGGNLATFEDSPNHFASILASALGHSGGNDDKVWIGGSDQITEGMWIWDPMEIPINSGFGHIKDNARDKNCLTVDPQHHFQFAAEECSSKKPYLCEIPGGNVAPATDGPVVG